LGAGLHVWYLVADCPLDLSGDEAHYWEWSRQLDLSYYSKGPLVAYLIAAGRAVFGEWSRNLLGNEELAVRLPAVALGLLTGLGLYVLGARVLRRTDRALAAVLLLFSVPILALGSMLMTIDAPLVCLWTWSLVLSEGALRTNKWRAWLLLGLLIALGVLAKYTMVLLFPVVGLAILTAPRRRSVGSAASNGETAETTPAGGASAVTSWRAYARRPGPYVATAIGLLGFVPIVVWNARHGWVSFRHVAGQAGVSEGPGFDAMGIISYFGTQLMVVNLLWMVAIVWVLIQLVPWRDRSAEPSAHAEESEGTTPVEAPEQSVPTASSADVHDTPTQEGLSLLWWAAVVPWGVFLLFSPVTKVQPNWPVVAVPPALLLLVHWFGERLRLPDRRTRRLTKAYLAAAFALGVSFVVVMHRTEVLMPVFDWLTRGSPPLKITKPAPVWDITPIARYDPTARLRGWEELGREVGELLAAERAAGRDPVVLTDDYQTASLLSFYTPGLDQAYCLQAALGERLSQYDLWENPLDDPQKFRRRLCLYVGDPHPELVGEKDEQTGMTTGGALPGMVRVETIRHEVRGHPLRIWSVYRCERYAGFPRYERDGDRRKY
jgi:hypothetical protein